MTFEDVQEKDYFVVTDELDTRTSEFREEREFQSRSILAGMFRRSIELSKTSSVLDGTCGRSESVEMFLGAMLGILVEGTELAVDIMSGNFCTVSNTHDRGARRAFQKGWKVRKVLWR